MRTRPRATIRLRLTLALVLSMAAVLIALGGFLRVRLGADLLRGIDLELRSRAGIIATALHDRGPLPVNAGRKVVDPDEAFAQVLGPAGHILDASVSVRSHSLLSGEQLRGVSAPTFYTQRVSGVDDPARLLALPETSGGHRVVIVVGANLGDRNEALRRLQILLLLGIPVALLIASGAGWLVAGAALRPVERIRSEAAEISRSSPDRRLTVPNTGDELARLADTLNALLSQQQDALARERRFVDEASHELRTPLAILKAELDLAISRPRSHAELTATVATVAGETDRLVALAEQLLILARSQPGPLPLKREPISLTQFLEQSAAPFRSRPGAPSAMVVEAPEEIVKVDILRLRQAVHNLLDNALRHGAGTPVVLSGRRDGTTVTITVADAGPGFPAEILERGMHPSLRPAVNGAGTSQRGVGLGLTIVGTVAQAHGGHARLANPPAGGARVDIFLLA